MFCFLLLVLQDNTAINNSNGMQNIFIFLKTITHQRGIVYSK